MPSFVFSLRNAECFQLRLVKWIRQIIEQILRPSSLSLAHRLGILAEQIGAKAAPCSKDVINHPLDRARPSTSSDVWSFRTRRAGNQPSMPNDRALRDVPDTSSSVRSASEAMSAARWSASLFSGLMMNRPLQMLSFTRYRPASDRKYRRIYPVGIFPSCPFRAL